MREPPCGRPQISVFRAGLGRLLPPNYLRVGPLAGIPRELARLGVEPAAIMAPLGIPPDIFAHPDNAVPFPAICRLMAASVVATGREDFGLLISRAVSPSELGVVGFLMKQAKNVGAALDDLVRYLHFHDTGAVPFLLRHGKMTELGYVVLDASLPAADIVHDGALAIACEIMRALCGPKWLPVEVMLSHRAPVNAGRYERHFGVPVRFDAERSSILFATDWLDTQIPSADPALRDMLHEQVRMMEESDGRTVAEKVRRLMRTVLLSGVSDLDDIASHLQMSPRALERLLKEEGCSFRSLSEDVRYAIAQHWLANTAMSITQIAVALNFSEVSSFSRAFSRWSGLSPARWRAGHHDTASPDRDRLERNAAQS